jgi:hypothetical protein
MTDQAKSEFIRSSSARHGCKASDAISEIVALCHERNMAKLEELRKTVHSVAIKLARGHDLERRVFYTESRLEKLEEAVFGGHR